jgi:hypothetical protein
MIRQGKSYNRRIECCALSPTNVSNGELPIQFLWRRRVLQLQILGRRHPPRAQSPFRLAGAYGQRCSTRVRCRIAVAA